MRDLSLHILDLMENSVRAGATVVAVCIDQQPAQDLLRIRIEDNGPGLPVTTEQAMDPFFTTKKGKRVGLGLSLFRAAAERAGGMMRLDRSALGGLLVDGTMQVRHIDRNPLGDLAATFSSAVCMNPDVDLRLSLIAGAASWAVSTSDYATGLPPEDREPVFLAQRLAQEIKAAIERVGIVQ